MYPGVKASADAQNHDQSHTVSAQAGWRSEAETGLAVMTRLLLLLDRYSKTWLIVMASIGCGSAFGRQIDRSCTSCLVWHEMRRHVQDEYWMCTIRFSRHALFPEKEHKETGLILPHESGGQTTL